MAKTKKMFMGGPAKAATQSANTPPKYGAVSQQMQFMDRLRGGKPAAPKMPVPIPRGAPNISPVGAQGPVASQQPTAVKTKTASPDGYGSKFPPGKAPPSPPDLEKMPGPTGMKKGGKVSSASNRGDGCAVRGKTKGRFV